MSARRLPAWAALPALVALLVAGASGCTATTGGTRWQAGSAAADPATVGPEPTRLRIPAIDVDTPLDKLGLDAHGALKAPDDFSHAGWYAAGSRPGDVGPAVIAGHVDNYKGPAVFFRLRELKQGDTVEVQRGSGWLKFRVLAVRSYPKNEFPTDEVYAPTPNPQLRLITCGGEFDYNHRSYLDNEVVYAVLA